MISRWLATVWRRLVTPLPWLGGVFTSFAKKCNELASCSNVTVLKNEKKSRLPKIVNKVRYEHLFMEKTKKMIVKRTR